MCKKHLPAVIILIFSWLISGCSGPAIHLRHHLGGAVDLGTDPARLQVGQFQVQPDTLTGLPPYLQNNLQLMLTDLNQSTSVGTSPITASASQTVEGGITVIAEDVSGVRPLRRWNVQTHDFEEREVSTLRRDVTVKVDFLLRNSAASSGDVTLETSRSYTSNQDPQVRGPESLLRPDDPDRVPPVDAIARHLIDECLSDFIAMIHPYEITAEVPLRYVGGTEAAAGRRAAKKGDYAEAARYFQSALNRNPSYPDLHFNLAVVQEAAGNLAAAEEQYHLVLERQASDESARTGLDRVIRLRRMHEYEQKLPPSSR
jgi:hypothetical protein